MQQRNCVPMGRAWVFNFDAEEELARPGRLTPSPSLRDRFAQLAEATGLLREGDLRVDEFNLESGCFRGMRGAAWCPTPRALRALRRAGAVVDEAPSPAVLRAANHRALVEGRVPDLPGGRWVRSEDDVRAALAEGSCSGRWLLKRAWAYNGRGRLRARDGDLDAHTAQWVRASLASADGLRMEPEVERSLDVAVHGEIARDGAVVCGSLTVQRCDAFGAWQGTEIASPEVLDAGEREALRGALREVVAALRGVGYWGPFGVDGFRWSGGFVPCCDVNARYTMGWSVGMAKSAEAFAVVSAAS